MVVEEGNTVAIAYTGRLARNNEVFDSNEGGEPLEFTAGQGQVIPGFDKAVMGLKKGDKKTVQIKADEAYGPHNAELVRKVPKEAIKGVEPEEGQVLGLRSEDGNVFEARVVGVEAEQVTLDFNHILAGEDLEFDIEIVDVRS